MIRKPDKVEQKVEHEKSLCSKSRKKYANSTGLTAQ